MQNEETAPELPPPDPEPPAHTHIARERPEGWTGPEICRICNETIWIFDVRVVKGGDQ